MQRVTCTSLRMFGRKAREATSYFAASRRYISALVILFVSGLLTHPAAAQTAPQTPVTRIRVKQPLSPEMLAMHGRAKRPVAAAATSLELAAATTVTSTTFNSDQGPGPGPIGPGPGCNLFPAPASIGTTVPLSYF